MKKLALILAALVTIFTTADATIRRVNNTPGMNSVYTTLSAAITAAAAGDTIHVEGSPTAYGGVNITKRLVIIGPGYFLADTAANPNTQAIKFNATADLYMDFGSKGSVVEGLTIGVLTLSDSFVTLQRNYFYNYITLASNNAIHGDTIRQNFMGASVSMSNVNGYKSTGLFVHNNIIEKVNSNFLNVSPLNNAGGFFINNSFVTPSTSEINLNCTNFTFQNNIFNKVTFSSLPTNIFINNIAKSGISAAANNNQINIESQAVYTGWNSPGTSTFSSDARYKLKTTAPASPAIGAGILNGAAVDCGAFGGPAPYVLSGMPPIPSIYQLDMPGQVNSGTPSVNVTISAASH